MIKYIIPIFIGILILGCNPNNVVEECCDNQSVDSAVIYTSSLEDSSISTISEVLVKSNNTEKNIKKIVKTNSNLNKENEVLQKTNAELASELKVVKDSLIEVQIQLKETLTKIPKKRNLFQKILGIAKDSVEIKHIDTLKN